MAPNDRPLGRECLSDSDNSRDGVGRCRAMGDGDLIPGYMSLAEFQRRICNLPKSYFKAGMKEGAFSSKEVDGDLYFKRNEVVSWFEKRLKAAEMKAVPARIITAQELDDAKAKHEEMFQRCERAEVAPPPKAIESLDIQHLFISKERPTVYFLCTDTDVVYIGQSVRMVNRVLSHVTGGHKIFDRVFFLTIDTGVFDLTVAEEAFIIKLQPKYNSSAKNKRLTDRHTKVLEHFGL